MWENVARRALHNGTKRRPHITCITHQNSKHERHRLTGFTRGSQRTNSCFPTVLHVKKSVNQRTHTTPSSILREKQRITRQNFLHPVHRRGGKDASNNDEANRTHMLRMRHAARHAENRKPRCALVFFFVPDGRRRKLFFRGKNSKEGLKQRRIFYFLVVVGRATRRRQCAINLFLCQKRLD